MAVTSVFVLLSIFLTTVYAVDPVVRIRQTDPPPLVLGGDLLNANRGDAVTLSCHVENLPEETTVRWKKIFYDEDGRKQIQKLSEDEATEDNIEYSIEKPSRYTWKLRINDAQYTDDGMYVCSVMTSLQIETSAHMRVEVLLSPQVTYVSSDTTAKKGDSILLRCEAEGRPEPTIEWKRLGGKLLPIGKEVHRGTTMLVENIQPDAMGQYKCNIFNSMGSVEKDINVKVQFPPIITKNLKEVSQAIGYVMELQCFIQANPRIKSIRWVQNTASIKSRTISESIARYEVKHTEGAFGYSIYELIFWPVTAEDYGDYTCIVTNDMETSRHTIRLTQSKGPQASIKLGKIISGSPSSVVLGVTSFLVVLSSLLLHLL